MKKRLFKATAVVVSVALLAACGGSASSSGQASSDAAASSGAAASSEASGDAVVYDPVTISIGTTGAAEDISTQAMEYMQDYLSDLTGGAMTIDLFPSSQLGNASAMMEMVQQGSLDIMLEGNYMNSYGVDDCKAGSVFMLNKSAEMYKALNESDLKADWENQFEDLTGIHILTGNFYRNPTCFISNVKIEKPEDVKNVKIRVPPSEIIINSMTAMGIAPTPIAYSESLLSLQQGVVDAIWCTEDAAYTMGFYEVAKYLIELNTDHDSMYLYTNANMYNSLSDNDRAALEEAAEAAAAYYRGLAADQLDKAVSAMKDAGIEVITLSSETVNEMFESALPYYYELEDSGAWTAGLIDQCLDITGQSNLKRS